MRHFDSSISQIGDRDSRWQHLENEAELLSQRLNGLLKSRKSANGQPQSKQSDTAPASAPAPVQAPMAELEPSLKREIDNGGSGLAPSKDAFHLSFDSAVYIARDNGATATFGPVYEVLLRRTEAGLGMRIAGGSDTLLCGLFVASLDPEGAAASCGKVC